jgi:Xaa-Pro aminopeptidase
MTLTAETLIHPALEAGKPPGAEAIPDRRTDIDAKHARVATFLQEIGCEGLVVLEPANFAWLTSGAASRGILNPAEFPALYFSLEGRWVIASNVDSQRLFDEELDGLGFQLKEWPWHWGRAQLLADVCQGRTVASDEPFGSSKVVADRLQQLRRSLTAYERACLRALGGTLTHALEATCRTMHPGDSERELAGQLAHRLIHRGVIPVVVGAAADGRSRRYRHFGFTSAPVNNSCVLAATGRKYGLCATASRSISFGPPDPTYRQEHNGVCKVCATYLASCWPDAVPREIFNTGRRVYLVSGVEHEWQLSPQGFVTGRAPVELTLTPQTEELFQAGWVVTWSPTVGAASSCDTFLIGEDGPQLITPAENWPLKRIRIQGADFFRPDVLQR